MRKNKVVAMLMVVSSLFLFPVAANATTRTNTGTYGGYNYTFTCTKETLYARATIDWETTSSFTPWTGISGTYSDSSGKGYRYDTTGGFSVGFSINSGSIKTLDGSGYLNGNPVASISM
jgi:hypothetical protein